MYKRGRNTHPRGTLIFTGYFYSVFDAHRLKNFLKDFNIYLLFSSFIRYLKGCHY